MQDRGDGDLDVPPQPKGRLSKSGQQPQMASSRATPCLLSSPLTRNSEASARSGSLPLRNSCSCVIPRGELMHTLTLQRQMQGLEDRLESHIARTSARKDQGACVASVVERRFQRIEAFIPLAERRLVEVSGSVRGVAEELQAQIRRIDQVDTGHIEFKSQVEIDIRNAFSKLDEVTRQVAASTFQGVEKPFDQLQALESRMRRVEGCVEQRFQREDAYSRSLHALDGRLQNVEARTLYDSLAGLSGPGGEHRGRKETEHSSASGPSIWDMLAEHARTVDRVKIEFEEMLSKYREEDMQTKVEAHQERISTLRTLMDTHEQHYRSVKTERQDVQTALKDVDSRVRGQQVRLEKCERRVEEGRRLLEDTERGQASSNAETAGACGGALSWDHSPIVEPIAGAGRDSRAGGAGCVLAVENSSRLTGLEDVVGTCVAEVATMRATADVGTRVASLVATLSQITPKLVDQDSDVQDLMLRVQALEADVMVAPPKNLPANAPCRAVQR